MQKQRKWLKLLAVFALVAAMMVTAVACGGNDSDNSGGDSDYSDIYVPTTSPYVRMITEARHSEYGITYGDAFDSFFASPKWEYFESTTGQHVVEFTGEFSYQNAPATAKIQFVLDLGEGTFTAYHLSINGEDQNKLMLSAMIQKVFESY